MLPKTKIIPRTPFRFPEEELLVFLPVEELTNTVYPENPNREIHPRSGLSLVPRKCMEYYSSCSSFENLLCKPYTVLKYIISATQIETVVFEIL